MEGLLMKLELKFEYAIDLEAERKHLMDTFAEEDVESRDRQLAILGCMEKGDLNSVFALYKELPYDKEYHCQEKEYVGLWLHNLKDILNYPNLKLMDCSVR
jgi:hypothetical protein